MDNDGRIAQMNPAAEWLTGMRSEELINQFLCERITFLDEGNRTRLNSPLHMCAETLGVEPLILLRQSGEELIVAPSGGTIHDSSGNSTGVVTVLRDITRERTRTHRLMYQATHDALTDLPNRLLFGERLSQHIYQADRNAEKLAVVFLDLDGFKRVNDTFGHHVGDNLLQSVAHRLRACVREGDSLARLAGDEFTMLVSGKGVDKGVEILASKVVRELTTPFDIQGNQISIGTSVGISIFPDDGASVDELMEKADAAMYQAKVQGGCAFRYYARQNPL
jgi:diguanylate cyclase (GGDEF)-like protein/PAS domain S-box-containing protein